MMNPIVLSSREKLVLRSYANMVEDLASYLGAGYEIVLHSLESFEHSVIKIINGYHTGRKEGAPITDLALNMLRQLSEQEGKPHGIRYFTQNRKGEHLKSTTIPVLGDNDRIIGLLCINFYLNTGLNDVLTSFLTGFSSSSLPVEKETFADDTAELLETSIEEIEMAVKKDALIPGSQKNKEIIRRLSLKGAFSFKGSVETVAEKLHISPNTVYLHLRNLVDKNRH